MGLGHDHGDVGAVFAEVGGREVAQLVQVQPGVLLDQGVRPVIAQPDPLGLRAEIPLAGGGAAAGAGSPFGQEQRPAGSAA